MSSRGSDQKESAELGGKSEALDAPGDCGFSLVADGDDAVEVLEKPERSEREDAIIREALGFAQSGDAKWFDAKGQSGPSPADFGDHKPIPVDSVCASIVVSEEED